MYTTINIRTETKEAFFLECENAGLVSDGEIIATSHNHFIDLIGELRKPTGKMLTDSEGNDYAETELIDGYHVNVRYKDPIGLEHLSIDVNNPLRVLA